MFLIQCINYFIECCCRLVAQVYIVRYSSAYLSQWDTESRIFSVSLPHCSCQVCTKKNLFIHWFFFVFILKLEKLSIEVFYCEKQLFCFFFVPSHSIVKNELEKNSIAGGRQIYSYRYRMKQILFSLCRSLCQFNSKKNIHTKIDFEIWVVKKMLHGIKKQ